MPVGCEDRTVSTGHAKVHLNVWFPQLGVKWLVWGYSFFFRVDVSTDLGGKSAILGAWEENRRKVRRFGRKGRKRREKEGERTERASAKWWKKSAPQAQKKNAF